MDAIAAELGRQAPGVRWDCLSQCREDCSGAFAASAEEAVLKIIGADLNALEKLAGQAKPLLENVAGVRGVRILPVRGLPQLALQIDRDKCRRQGIATADVNDILRCALEGKTVSQMIEGEKMFDIALRWPAPLRRNKEAILDLPLDVVKRERAPFPGAAAPRDNPPGQLPRSRLRDVAAPLGEKGEPGVAALYREGGERVLLLRVGVRGRAQSAVCAAAEQDIAALLKHGYRLEWDCAN
jgi:cobalt-zinc-cadmium resistance protein CzcA